ncbi:MAG: hypothetical protein IPI05_15820 [Flavobacteriales bacterium]|nr:hypothetical protein [Flavobacteriales bacterium]
MAYSLDVQNNAHSSTMPQSRGMPFMSLTLCSLFNSPFLHSAIALQVAGMFREVKVFRVVNEEHCGNAAPDFCRKMERNDTISASACRSWTIAEEQARCGPSTLETWRLYDCNYETKEECLTGSSWYRIAYFSFYEKPKGSEAIYYNGYSVTIFKDGLVLDGAIKYVCSEPMDVRPKQQWMLSWLKAIKILTEEEWKDSLRRVEK